VTEEQPDEELDAPSSRRLFGDMLGKPWNVTDPYILKLANFSADSMSQVAGVKVVALNGMCTL